MIIKRKKTRKVLVGSVAIGGGSPISIQSMTKTDTRDVVKTVNQIKQLEKAGCEIVRVAVEDAQAAKAISRIKSKINIPLVADIHFHYKLAIMAAENGADKLRLNPGNIAKRDYIYQVIDCAKAHNIPIRIGLNSGSVKRKKGSTLVNDLVSSADAYLKIFKFKKFEKLILSLKTPEVGTTIEAYRKMSEVTDAPLHLGVTATGLPLNGIVKTSMALGVLLQEGIGDTLRVSLTADPIEEIPVAQDILQALGIRNFGIEVISCPTCGRCSIGLIDLVKKVKKKMALIPTSSVKKKLKVAVMGCVVNGPGEAKDADLGIAWAGKQGLLFKRGKLISRVSKKDLLKVLLSEVMNEMV